MTMSKAARTKSEGKAETHLWRDESGEGPFLYVTGMKIDADGCPTAYHPDSKSGLDKLGNAGEAGNWYGVVTDSGDCGGKPVVQSAKDPAPGFYISPTSLADSTNKSARDPRRYVDSQTVPYIAFPSSLRQLDGTKIMRVASPKSNPGAPFLDVNKGDFVIVYNLGNGQHVGTIVADVGPADKLGEASIRAASAIGINANARGGGVETRTVAYLVFPKSHPSPEWPQTVEQIQKRAGELFDAWGGVERLTTEIEEIRSQSVSFSIGDDDDDRASDLPERGTYRERDEEE